MENIKLDSYQITYVPKSDYCYNELSPIYNIRQIDHLVHIIMNGQINTIYHIHFIFRVNTNYFAGFVYYPKTTQDSNYSFAPCYNYKTFDSILDTHKTYLINTLINTLQQYSSDIKKVFIDYIDPSKEIIHEFVEDD